MKKVFSKNCLSETLGRKIKLQYVVSRTELNYPRQEVS